MARSPSDEGTGADGTGVGKSSGEADTAGLAPSRLGPGSLLLGKYRLDELLGEGGMGAVWRAHHLQLDSAVALKLLRPGPDRTTLSERLKIEARAAARLVHPAIVRVFDIDVSEDDEPFIVMELLAGESLAELLDRGRLSGVSAVQTLLPIAEALVLAHAKGIVHRDLKPHNVFLALEGERMQPKLLDFGIAKLTSAPTPAGSLTDTGVLLGSPDYMSPEQARGSSDIDHRADIWQFCVVLYEAVSCRTPFAGDNYNALMRAIVEDDPAPLQLDDSLDHRLADLILWGLAKRREERPESMQEFGRALAQWLLDRGVAEDMFGASLAAKWITGSAQKSLPVVQVEAIQASRREELPSGSLAVSGTLLSRRLSSATPARHGAAPSRRLLRIWSLALGAALLLSALAWVVTRPTAPEKKGTAGPEPVAIAPPVVSKPEIAATPASPLSAQLAPAATPPFLSASPAPRTSAQKPPRSAPSASAARAVKPPAVDHDETRELLQAY